MDTQKAQVVSSYVRYKTEKVETKDNSIVAGVMAGSIIILIAVIFWQVTLTLVATGAVTNKLHKVRAHREWLKQNGLAINYWNGKKEFV